MTGRSEASQPDRVYANAGNVPLIELLEGGFSTLLDVGCGAGDTAALIAQRFSGARITGITHSEAEAALARRKISECWVFDIEGTLPEYAAMHRFDVLVFSHVLEHLRDPASVLARFTQLLNPGGQVLVAVPNILSWRMRARFVAGSFEYDKAGELDDTHLRFFTYLTADRYLFSQTPELSITHKTADGSVPLFWLRRHVLSKAISQRIDKWGSTRWPNLFGGQILMRAVRA